VIRPSVESFLLAWGLLAPAAVVLALPLCGLIFWCGCTLTSGWRWCNIHTPGPHCPWCAQPRSFALAFALSVAGASGLMVCALRFRRSSMIWATVAGAVGFWLTLSAAGLVTAKLSGYPRWYGLRLD
jgi:hypothetical protein